MAELEQLVGRWGHSFEEDHDDVIVYRPESFDFPRARGRAGIELRPDGSFVDWAIGAGDAAEARPGAWQLAGGDTVRIVGASGEARALQVAHVSADRLELRREGAS
jgi:hypothetical protein